MTNCLSVVASLRLVAEAPDTMSSSSAPSPLGRLIGTELAGQSGQDARLLWRDDPEDRKLANSKGTEDAEGQEQGLLPVAANGKAEKRQPQPGAAERFARRLGGMCRGQAGSSQKGPSSASKQTACCSIS